jgi:hypothetical protein
MKFKDWLKNEMIGTAILNGGIGESPGENINDNMPIRSKTSATFGHKKNSSTNIADKIFGFNKADKKRSIGKGQSVDKSEPANRIAPSLFLNL